MTTGGPDERAELRAIAASLRAYLELQGAFDPDEDHWTKLAEIEPVVAPYGGGETFDGWIVLPVMAARSAWALVGNGFEPRTRIQIRASAYLVS